MSNVVRLADARVRKASPAAANSAGGGRRLLTASEIATELRISERQVRRMRAEGMPSVPVTRTRDRYVLADVLQFLEHQRQRPTPAA